MSGRLTDIDVDETSGVDHPAHLEEGWVLMKSRDEGLAKEFAALLKEATSECPGCGAAVPKGDAYCPGCGKQMAKSTAPTPADRIGRLRRLHKALGRLISDEQGGEGMTTDTKLPEALVKFLDEAKASDEVRKAIEDLAQEPKVDETPANAEEALLKDVPEAVRKMLDEQRERADRLEKSIADERKERATAEAIEKAAGWKHLGVKADEFGPQLQELRSSAPEVAKTIESALDSAEKLAAQSALFSHFGKDVAGGESEPEGKLDALAKARIEKSTEPLDYATAYAEVLETPEGAALYAELSADTNSEVRR